MQILQYSDNKNITVNLRYGIKDSWLSFTKIIFICVYTAISEVYVCMYVCVCVCFNFVSTCLFSPTIYTILKK